MEENLKNADIVAALLTVANVLADRKAFLEPAIEGSGDAEIDPKKIVERFHTFAGELSGSKRRAGE